MPRDELIQSWQRTRAHLATAFAMLSAVQGAETLHGCIRGYLEFLEHNELELALDELELLGEENFVPCDYWAALAEAAAEMKLMEHTKRYRKRVESLREP